jgi:hypothetical protein
MDLRAVILECPGCGGANAPVWSVGGRMKTCRLGSLAAKRIDNVKGSM